MTATVAAGTPVAVPAGRQHRALEVLRRVVTRPAGALALGFLVLLVLVAVFGPLIAPFDPNAQSLRDQYQPPSWEHWLGTDDFGRDVLSRLIYATRYAVIAPVVAVVVAVVLGLPTGLFAGYRPGRLAAVMSRVSETLMSIPPIVAAIAIIAVLGRGLVWTMLTIGIVYSPRLFRIVRGAALSVSEETFISSAESIGASTNRVVWMHCLPNVLAPLLVQVTLLMGFALLAESSLSYLGLGVQPPQASWGTMLKAATQQQFRAPFAVVPPGVALTLTILALNTLGDVLRDATADRSRS